MNPTDHTAVGAWLSVDSVRVDMYVKLALVCGPRWTCIMFGVMLRCGTYRRSSECMSVCTDLGRLYRTYFNELGPAVVRPGQ